MPYTYRNADVPHTESFDQARPDLVASGRWTLVADNADAAAVAAVAKLNAGRTAATYQSGLLAAAEAARVVPLPTPADIGALAATPAGRAFVSGIVPPRLPAGEYNVPANSGTGTAAGWTLGEVRLVPLDIPVAQAYVGLATNITVVGAGGTAPLVHLGLYADDGTGNRPALAAPMAGTEVTFNPATGGTGERYVAWAGGAQTLQPSRVWAAFQLTSGSAMSTVPTFVVINNISQMGLANLSNVSHRAWARSGGANDATLPALSGLYRVGAAPIVGLKAQ